jgi:hypothetical protein
MDIEVAASFAGNRSGEPAWPQIRFKASRARAWSGPTRTLASVFGRLSSPFVKERRTWTTRPSRSTSRFSSAIHSAGRSPVATAKMIIGP